jgi:hypothetical protein
MQVKSRIAAALALLAVTAGAQADGYAVGGIIGTNGIGLDFTNSLTDTFTVSLDYGKGKINTTRSISDISYKADSTFGGVGFKASYFPLEGSNFHVTGGFLLNNTELDAEAQPDGGYYHINGTPYPASNVGGMRAKIQFPSSSPYIGVGWGNPVRAGSKVNFTVDLGVQYLKSINASLTATCNNSAINGLDCTRLQNDVALEEAQLQSEMNKVSWWPSARIGLHYQF